MKESQLVIVGGGPAGLTAGIYAGRARLATVLIEREIIGGQITYTPLLENYPGFPEGVSGNQIGELMEKQARAQGIEIVLDEVTGLEVRPEGKLVKTNGETYRARAVILAGGCRRLLINVPGEKEFTGRGVFYCATCDGPLYRNKAVVVVGGGDAAITEALYMTRFASSVTVVHRRSQLRASKVLQERAFAEPKMKFAWDSVVKEIKGDKMVTSVILQNVVTGQTSQIEAGGVLVAIGHVPNTEYLKGIVNLDEAGYIITDQMMATSVAGVFAAGDIRHNSIRQVVSAAGDGGTAAVAAERYISEAK
jgi:thioredoxin reductase (NADPH)